MSSAAPVNQDPRRLFLFMVLSFVLILGTNILLDRLGLLPRPEPEKAAQAVQGKAEGAVADAAAEKKETPESAPPAKEPVESAKPIAVAPAGSLRLGSLAEGAKSPYHLEVELDQRGAGVWAVQSSRFDAEYDGAKVKKRPLTLVKGSARAPLPFSMVLLKDEAGETVPTGDLDQRVWDVVVGDQLLSDLPEEARATAEVVRPIKNDQGQEIGQSISFRTTVGEEEGQPSLTITKTYRLFQGKDAVDVQLTADASDAGEKPRSFAYRLNGPSGMPIEGEWYTYTFRNAYLGKDKSGSVSVETHSGQEVATAERGTYENTQVPLAFAGVENQYFAVFVRPVGAERLDARTELIAAGEPAKEPKKADLSVEIDTQPVAIPPGGEARQEFQLFAGPKTPEALAPYNAGELAHYRTIGHVPVIGFLFDALNAVLNPPATFLSGKIINPLLNWFYGITRSVSGWFGGTRGSYGIAIILLTVTVRLLMFPLSRKQAISAKRMQDLQPHMAALREKHGEDKEKIAAETFALYRKHGINPLAGCLPVLVQVPIFMALWRTLNVSVALRQAPFLWMDNLAAPDMLFGFDKLFGTGANVPMLGPYFNLLPLAVVALMFMQTKLFSPPATTPEQEMQQKVMKYMMAFMAVMFYRVPSGLAIYFITSSLWSIGERLLLPKIAKGGAPPLPGSDDSGPNDGPKPPEAPPSRGGWLTRKLQELMEEAEKERTYRREAADKEKDRAPDRDKARSAPPWPGGDPEPKRSRPRPDPTKPGKRR